MTVRLAGSALFGLVLAAAIIVVLALTDNPLGVGPAVTLLVALAVTSTVGEWLRSRR